MKERESAHEGANQASGALVRLKFDSPQSSNEPVRRGHIDVDEVHDRRPYVDCEAPQLSEPMRAGDAAANAVAVLQYDGPPVDTNVTAVRASVVIERTVLSGQQVTEPALSLVSQEEVGPSSRSLTLRGAPEQLWHLAYLLRMASNPGRASVQSLTNELQRWAWIQAALDFSAVITPWGGIGNVDLEFAISRPIPDEVSVVVEPALFQSESTFFSAMGERLLGPAGYAGKDFQGFQEILRVVAHRAGRLNVEFVELDECKRVSERQIGGGFFGHIDEIFSQAAGVGY